MAQALLPGIWICDGTTGIKLIIELHPTEHHFKVFFKVTLKNDKCPKKYIYFFKIIYYLYQYLGIRQIVPS